MVLLCLLGDGQICLEVTIPKHRDEVAKEAAVCRKEVPVLKIQADKNHSLRHAGHLEGGLSNSNLNRKD